MLGILTILFIPKIISVDEYGNWKLFTLYLSFAGILNIGVLDGTYLSIGGKRLKDISNIFFKYLLYNIIVVLAALLTIAIPLLILKSKDLFWYLIINGLSYNIIGYYVLNYNAVAEFKYANIINVMNKFLFILFILIFFILNRRFNLQIVLILYTLSQMVISIAIIYSFILKFKIKINIIQKIKTNSLIKIIRTGFPLLIANLIQLIIYNLDLLVISIILDIYSFAYYAFAVTVIKSMLILNRTVRTVVFPSAMKKKSVIITNYKDINYLLFILPLILIPFLNLCISFIIEYYLPNYINSITYIIILTYTLPYLSLLMILHYNTFAIYKLQNQYLKNSIIAVIAGIILNIPGYIYQNAKYVAYATLITYLIYIVLNQLELKHRIKITFHITDFFLYLLPFIYILLYILGGKNAFIFYGIFLFFFLISGYKRIKSLNY